MKNKKVNLDSKSVDVKTLANSRLIPSLVSSETRFDSAEDASSFSLASLTMLRLSPMTSSIPN